MGSGKPEAHAARDVLETLEILNEPPTADPPTDEQMHRTATEKLVARIRAAVRTTI